MKSGPDIHDHQKRNPAALEVLVEKSRITKVSTCATFKNRSAVNVGG